MLFRSPSWYLSKPAGHKSFRVRKKKMAAGQAYLNGGPNGLNWSEPLTSADVLNATVRK